MTQVFALLAGETAFRASVAPSSGNAEIILYDAIGDSYGGISATRFRDELKKLAGAQQITVRINSPGGSVFDGLTMHNSLARHPARVTVSVDGIAASIASVIAMAGDDVVMPTNSMMFLHNAAAALVGNADDM